jgi:CHASE1-domain containing sensor protein
MVSSPATLRDTEHGLRPATSKLRLFVWSVTVFVLALAVTAWLLGEYHGLRESERQEAAKRATERTLHALRGQLETCATLLRSVQALFIVAERMDAAQFRQMYEVLRPRQEFAGLQAVVFSRRSAPADGPLAYVTDLVEPLAGNERVFGLDVVSQPDNLVAVERSRDTDQPVMSRSFRLIQRTGLDEPLDGVVMRIPAFSGGAVPRSVAERRAREVGSIGVSFRVSELIHAGLAQTFDPLYQVRVTDVTDGANVLLYDSQHYGRTGLGDPTQPLSSGRLVYGGRVWEVSQQPVPGAAADALPLLFGGLVGFLLSLLMALLVWTLVSRREHALRQAETLSRRFRESEARFRALNEMLPVAVVLSHAPDGRLEYVN